MYELRRNTSVLITEDQLFEKTFNSSPICNALIDLNWDIVKANHSFYNLFSCTQRLPHNLKKIIYPEDVEKVRNCLKELLIEESTNQIEVRCRGKKGEVIWTLLSISCIHKIESSIVYHIQIQNITKYKEYQKEKELFEQSQKLIIENSLEATLIVMDNRCVEINKLGLVLLGAKSKKEVVGKSPFTFIDSKFHHLVKERMKMVNQGKIASKMEQQWISNNGNIIDVEITSIPIIHESKKALYVMVKDISERKISQELMLQSEKLTTAGQLAAGIAHEIRNPLTAMKGFLQLIETGWKEKEIYFEIIMSEINRIEMILNELLILAKPKSPTFCRKNVEILLEQVITFIQTQAILNNIDIRTIIEPNIPLVTCDENQLKQVIINLIKNSIEAMPKGGKIVVSVKRFDKNHITISILDEGGGIPKEHLQQLGKPFYTTKEKGTGLGLTICFQIIESHNGQMNITSSKSGTLIEVKLPIANEK